MRILEARNFILLNTGLEGYFRLQVLQKLTTRTCCRTTLPSLQLVALFQANAYRKSHMMYINAKARAQLQTFAGSLNAMVANLLRIL